MKKRIKDDKKKRAKDPDKQDDSSDDEDKDTYESIQKKLRKLDKKKEKRDRKKLGESDSDLRKSGNFFSVSSESESSSSESSSDDERKQLETRRKQSLKDSKSRRPGSARPRSRQSGYEDERPGSSLSKRRISTSASGLLGKGAYRDEEGEVRDLKVPLYEEYTFVCQKWLAVDMDDGLCERELAVAKKNTYFKE